MAAIGLLGTVAVPVNAAKGAPEVAPAQDVEVSADLDGMPIPLVEVGQWYCHDFDYPAIHCFSNPDSMESTSRAGFVAEAAAAGVNYVTVYEFTTYQGAFMHMSEDYSMLSLIGWNDRISSYIAKNSMSGVFWTNWLYSGTRYTFCCNQWVGSLGSFNDTFSSVFHN